MSDQLARRAEARHGRESEDRSFSDPTTVLRIESAEWEAATPADRDAARSTSSHTVAYTRVPRRPPESAAAASAATGRRRFTHAVPGPVDRRSLLRQPKPAPSSGWRRLLYVGIGSGLSTSAKVRATCTART